MFEYTGTSDSVFLLNPFRCERMWEWFYFLFLSLADPSLPRDLIPGCIPYALLAHVFGIYIFTLFLILEYKLCR